MNDPLHHLPSYPTELTPAGAMEQAAMTAEFYLRSALAECERQHIQAGPERGLIVAGFMQAAASDYAAWNALQIAKHRTAA